MTLTQAIDKLDTFLSQFFSLTTLWGLVIGYMILPYIPGFRHKAKDVSDSTNALNKPSDTTKAASQVIVVWNNSKKAQEVWKEVPVYCGNSNYSTVWVKMGTFGPGNGQLPDNPMQEIAEILSGVETNIVLNNVTITKSPSR